MYRFRHLLPSRWFSYLVLGLFLPLLFSIANAQTQTNTTDNSSIAQEIIENYESAIAIRQDGRLKVTETITVRNTAGGEIKRGIYRNFPNPEFEITSIQRNGKPATYRTEIKNGRKRVEIWKNDVYLDPGYYTYQIQYLTDQQIEDLGEQDQLYWNV